MRLLDRYLLRELMIPLAYCLSGFLVFWIAFDLLSDIDKFQTGRLGVFEVMEYYAYRIPQLLYTVLPVALLMALLYELTALSRNMEITAIRAAGVSLWRLIVPLVAVGIGGSLLIFLLNDVLLGHGLRAADAVLKRYTSEATGGQWVKNVNFNNERDNRVWSIGAYHEGNRQMTNVIIEWNQPDGSMRRIIAGDGLYTNQSWELHGVTQFIYANRQDTPPPDRTNEVRFVEFEETPAHFEGQIRRQQLGVEKFSEEVLFSLPDILDYLRLHPGLKGEERAIWHTQLHGRLAQPWTCLVVVLIAVPFGLVSGRRNAYAGVAVSIFICFAYFVVMQVGLALGTSARLPPWLAAWLPNALFAGTGLLLIARAN